MRLEGKVVLVTGSTTGIGEGIARRAASEGASVVVHGQEDDPGVPGSFLVRGDLEDPETPERLVAAALERFGRLDGLVNNAGVCWRAGPDDGATFFDRMMAINARAPFLMVRAARPHLKGGSVVNIGSVNAHATGEELLPYGMSKAALENLTRTLAGPLARDRTRINALNLGWTLTPNERRLLVETNGWAEDWPETTGARMPFGRLLLPEDVAAMACYLLSDEAAMVTGQVWGFDQRPH